MNTADRLVELKIEMDELIAALRVISDSVADTSLDHATWGDVGSLERVVILLRRAIDRG